MFWLKRIRTVLLITMPILLCAGCSGIDTLSDNLKGGVEQLGDGVAIGQSNALITPYQSFDGTRTSDNDNFIATYNATVIGFNGKDILVADTDLKKKECREVTVDYNFQPDSGICQLIYISPSLEEKVLSENGNGNVKVQLQKGANYIGISGTDYSGTIQLTVE
jgi:hypothetical protein